jgi:hypothetical protein
VIFHVAVTQFCIEFENHTYDSFTGVHEINDTDELADFNCTFSAQITWAGFSHTKSVTDNVV